MKNVEIINTADGMFEQMKNNQSLIDGKFPMFVFKLLDLQKGFEIQEDDMMVNILDDIMVDVWDYIHDVRPDLGFNHSNK